MILAQGKERKAQNLSRERSSQGKYPGKIISRGNNIPGNIPAKVSKARG
jgi:hypothetical protein